MPITKKELNYVRINLISNSKRGKKKKTQTISIVLSICLEYRVWGDRGKGKGKLKRLLSPLINGRNEEEMWAS